MTGMPYYRKEKSPESIRRTPTIEELKHRKYKIFIYIFIFYYHFNL